jgi:hypothetical protein
MKKHQFILGFICAASLFMGVSAHSQDIKMVEFTTKPSLALKKAVRKSLDEKINKFYKEYSYIPYLQYGFVDLNSDHKNEIIVRFAEEYEFRDRHNNVDTHIFAQTSKGLVQILETQAFSIGIAPRDHTALNQIYAYKGKSQRRYERFGWDGKREYKKTK